jgi:lysophospholipase L1-like esterase
VAGHARFSGVNLTSYNLGIRCNTSRDIALRWQQECAARFPADCQRYVVFSFGVNDTTIEDGTLRVPEAESLEHFRTIVSQASAQYATAVVGPPPIADASQNARIRHLSDRFAEAAQTLNVPYLPVYETLQADPVWMAEVAAQDGAHPGAQGYPRLADLVLAWPQWWFQSSVMLRWEVPQVLHRQTFPSQTILPLDERLRQKIGPFC